MIRFQSIEILRFLAAAGVYLSHCSPSIQIPILWYFVADHYFHGAIGVDIFFVISGLVMGLSAQRSIQLSLPPRRFVVHRLAKIFPIYWLITIVWVLIILVHDKRIPGLSYFLDSIFLLPSNLDPIIRPAWSLRYELYFYLIVLLGIKSKRVLAVPSLLILLGCILNLYTNFFYGASITIEFLLGYWLSFQRDFKTKKNQSTAWAGFFLSLLLLLFASIGTDFQDDPSIVPTRMWIYYRSIPTLPRFFAWGFPAFSLVFFASRIHLKTKFSVIGKFTYSFYLLQFPFFCICSWWGAESLAWNAISFFSFTTLIGIASICCYYFLEFPCFFRLRRKYD